MPRKGRGHANETTASERAEILTPQQQSKRARTSSTPSPSPSPSQLSPDEKVAKRAAFAQAHLRARVLKSTDWKDEEKALRDEYGAFGYNFPKKCYDKLLSLGSLVAHKSTGRPKVHSDEVVVYQIRQARRADIPGQKPHRLSSRKMAEKLRITASDDSPTPSRSTICRIKKRLGFERIKRKKKPMVNLTTRAKRLDFAKDHDGFDFTYWVIVDEKMFTEDKHKNEEIEARHCSPLNEAQLFFTMAAETATQLKKKMFLVGVSEGIKIGFYEVDCTDDANVLKKRDAEGNPIQAKGMGAALFSKLAKQLYDDARKVWPTGFMPF